MTFQLLPDNSKFKHNTDRRTFIKTLSMAGLAFSGISGLSCSNDSKENVKLKHWDVIVVGGGPGGVPAAVAAARNGARTLLVERYGFLGGNSTVALVYPFMKYSTRDQILSQGLFKEFLDILATNGALLDDRASFDAEPMKWLLDKFVLDSKADLLLHTQAIGVLKDNDKIKAIRLFHKEGIEDVSADVYIDSTGDGDLAAWGGAEIELGRKSDGAVQPMTTGFRIADVDIKRLPSRKEIDRLFKAAKDKGEINIPMDTVNKFIGPHPNSIHFNSTRVIGKSGLNSWDMTDAEVEGRRQVSELVRFFKKYVPGFESSYLMKMGMQIGVRETRRIMGKYLLNVDDILFARHFEDGIACANYPVDIHNPSGAGYDIRHLKEGQYYEIPYRCLLPEHIDNLIVASRCISATHEAHASLRVMPTIWSIGQAAGTAAMMSVEKAISPEQIDVKTLRKKLMEQGAFVG